MRKIFLAILILTTCLFAYQFQSIVVSPGVKADSIIGAAADTIKLGTALQGAWKLHGMYYLDTLADKSSNIKLNIQVSANNTDWIAFHSAAAADSWVTENTWTIDTTRYSLSTIGLFKYSRFIFSGVYSNQKCYLTYVLGCWK